jgi:tRNA pseudouridine38-40 synthase
MALMIRMDIAYDGSFSYGFQKQGALMTVQGTLEQALKAVTGVFVPVVGSSRTDRGVHALHNVVSFVVRDPATRDRIARRLPVMLPEWLTVRSVEEVGPTFNARFSTTSKAYAYLFMKQGSWSPFLARYGYRLDYQVDVGRMRDAACSLVGTHDFALFGSVDPGRPHRGTTCTLYDCDIAESEKSILFTVVGDHFLYHMVRRMAYFVLKAGQHRIETAQLSTVFSSGSTPFTRQVIAAGGLYLVRVEFPS